MYLLKPANLKIIFKNVINTGRGIIGGRTINIKGKVKLWQMFRSSDKKNSFVVNKKHPLYVELKGTAGNKLSKVIDLYIGFLEAYMPLRDIAREQMNNPLGLKDAIDREKMDLKPQIEEFMNEGLTEAEIKFLIGSEGFENEDKDNE